MYKKFDRKVFLINLNYRQFVIVNTPPNMKTIWYSGFYAINYSLI